MIYRPKLLRQQASNQAGMALLEVIVAMLVFALAILPLVRLQVMSMDATKAGYYKTETAAAAQSMMDYLDTDITSVFAGDWNDVAVSSNCAAPSINSGLNNKQKIACNILNGNTGSNTHAAGNAVLCVYGKRPSFGTGSNKKFHDQYLISIRAIWYSGKRQESSNGHNFHNVDLTDADCGGSYDDAIIPAVVANENIDYIKINMAY